MFEHVRGREIVAVFTPEIGIDQSLPFYTGGLGILEGGRLRAAYRMDLPVVGISIRPKRRFQQLINWDRLRMEFEFPEISTDGLLESAGEKFTIPIGTEYSLWIDISYVPHGRLGTTDVLFLSTCIPENNDLSQSNTEYLYAGPRCSGSNEERKLAQMLVLGKGGVEAFRRCGLEVRKYHLNESYCVFAALTLLEHELFFGRSEEEAVDCVKSKVAYTNHTPLASGNPTFPLGLVEKIWGYDSPVDRDLLERLGGNPFSATVACLRLAGRVNAVSKRHRSKMLEQWAGIIAPNDLGYVTNGQDVEYWQHPYCLDVANPFDLARQKQRVKREFLDMLQDVPGGYRWSEDILTLGSGRRWQAYKRMLLIFRDLPWIVNHLRECRFQLVMAGKPHPNDNDEIEAFNYLLRLSRELPNIIVIEDYDLDKMKLIKAGVDAWLNTPVPPLEACGTSGMGVVFNGGMNISIRDGWLCEVNPANHFLIESFRPGDDEVDSFALRQMIDDHVIPLFYHHKGEWYQKAFNAMQEGLSCWGSDRMLKQYWNEMYQ